MSDDTKLELEIGIKSDTDQGFATEDQRLDAWIASVDRASAHVHASSKEVEDFSATMQRLAHQTNSDNAWGNMLKQIEQVPAKIKEAKQPVDELTKAFSSLGEKAEHAFSIGSVVDELGGKLLGVVGIVAIAEKGFELMGEAAREAFDFIKEGIAFSDRMRDIHLSFDTITGSTERATKALEFFEQAEHKTRNTAIELEEAFRKMEPLAAGKGFSQQSTEQMTVWLAQLATARGESLDSMEGGLQRILAGRVTPGRNPILAALGITKDDIKNMGWDEFIGKISEAAQHAEKFGDSFESTMHKAKDALLVSFSEGFLGARGSAEQGMGAIDALVADPAVKDALHDLGAASAVWVTQLAGVAVQMAGIAVKVEQLATNPFVQFLMKQTQYGLVLTGIKGFAEAGVEQMQEEAMAQKRKASEMVGWEFLNAALPGYHNRSGVNAMMRHAGLLTPGFGNLQPVEQQIGEAVEKAGLTEPQKLVLKIEMRDAATEHQLSFADFKEALTAANESPALTGTPKGPLVTADKSKQEAKNAMDDYIHSLEDGLRLEEQHLANQQKIANAILGRSALEKTLTDLDFGYQKEVLGLTEKQEAAQARLDQARAFGTAADRERYGKLIEATKAEVAEAARAHDMLKSLAADDFFRKMDDATAKQALQDQLALDRASKVLSPHQEAMQAIDLTSQERILKIEEQLRDAYTASAYAFSKGSVEDAAAANVLILKLTESWSAAKTFHDQIKQITEDEFWTKFADENKRALDDAEVHVTDFADKWERSLSAMSPALADQARKQIETIRDEVEVSMALIEQFMLKASMPAEWGGLGLAADDPELLRLRAEMVKRVNEQAGIGLSDNKAVIDETNKVQVDAAHKALDVWQNNLGGIFSSAAEGVAKGFMSAIAGDFQNLVSQGGKNLAGLLSGLFGFGTPGNPTQMAFGTDAQGYPVPLGLQQPGQFYKDGHLVTSTGAKYGQAAIGFAEIGVGAYQMGQQPGGRTAGALSGAVGGAALGAEIGSAYPVVGTIVGAVVGLIVGEIGSYLGSQAAKADWKYFMPAIDKTGQASLAGAQNLSDASQRQIVSQIQAKFDATNDAMIDLVLKLGQTPLNFLSKLVETGQPILGVPGGIPGQGQLVPGVASRPAAGFMQDFQAWLTDTLPRTIEDFYTSQVSTGFEKLGLASDRFKLIFAALDKIDPSKTISLLNQLADAINSIDQSMAAFTTANQMTGIGSDIFSLITGQLGLDKTQTYAQRIQGTTRQSTSSGIGFQEATGDYAILDFASGIHNKSIEGQITDEGKLATMLKSRYDAEKAAITEIYNLSVNAKADWESLNKQLTLQGMTKVENGQIVPDNEAQANFLKSQADTDLTRIQTAHNATEANQAWQDFKSDVLGAGNAAIAKANLLTDPNARKAAIDEVLAWERKSLGIGETDLQANLTKMGDSINTLDDLFTEKLIPSLKELGIAIDKNTGAITSPTNPLSPTNPGTSLPDPHTPKEPDPGFAPLTGVVRDGNIAIVGGLGDIASLIQDLISAVDEGFGKSGKHSGADSSQMLAAQIVMGRVA